MGKLYKDKEQEELDEFREKFEKTLEKKPMTVNSQNNNYTLEQRVGILQKKIDFYENRLLIETSLDKKKSYNDVIFKIKSCMYGLLSGYKSEVLN